MNIKVGIVMDPIEQISFHKDTSLALMFAAQQHGCELFYMEQQDLSIQNGVAYGRMAPITVAMNPDKWFEKEAAIDRPLSDLQLILMRKDPPFDSEFIYSTYILERAEQQGVVIANKPQSLRDCNEKVFATEFPECCTPFLVASDQSLLRDFIQINKDTVIKPLDGMGGSSIFRLRENDPNIAVVLETITSFYKSKVMIQRYIPEIVEGDKRILMINGEPMGAAIARVPAKGELRGNLAAGATAIAKSLTERDLWICSQVGPKLKDIGLVLVGLDVIGDYLTEINVTSPTCFREYRNLCDIEVSRKLMDCVENIVNKG